MTLISIICIYNNRKILEDYFLKSLKMQNVDYELILINNTKKRFKSAAEALNFGGNKATGKYILFIHQDVDLYSENLLNDLEIILNSIDNIGVTGIAGKTESSSLIISNIVEGTKAKLVGKIQINKPVKVQTLDECFFIIPKVKFDLLKFDEKVCSGWHLYAVDYCLCALERGWNVHVLPIKIFHRSAGDSFSDEYYVILKKLFEKHKNNFKWINTTMGNWNSIYPLKLQIIYNRTIFYWTRFKKMF